MAPLPDNLTGVHFIDYAGDFGQRTMQFRHESALSPSDHRNAVADFIEAALVPFWFDQVSVTGARYRAAGSDITLPVAFPAFTGEVSGTQTPFEYPEFLAWQGRGITSGRKVRLSVYGVSMSVTDNYRLVDAEGPYVTPLVTALKGIVLVGAFVTIAGDRPVIYDYLNAGYNAYYQRKARRSS